MDFGFSPPAYGGGFVGGAGYGGGGAGYGGGAGAGYGGGAGFGQPQPQQAPLSPSLSSLPSEVLLSPPPASFMLIFKLLLSNDQCGALIGAPAARDFALPRARNAPRAAFPLSPPHRGACAPRPRAQARAAAQWCSCKSGSASR
jgi:hypothetical protein